jgi:hypothetical protein
MSTLDMSTLTNPHLLNRTSSMERRQSKGIFGSLRHSLSKNEQSTSNTTPQSSPLQANHAARPTQRLAPPPIAGDAYAWLDGFGTSFVIDDSGSMAGSLWRQTADALMTITPVCTAHDADRTDIHYISHPSHNHAETHFAQVNSTSPNVLEVETSPHCALRPWSPPPVHDYKAALVYEPSVSGFLTDKAVTFFPDNQSAHDIMSHDYAKRNHFKINSSTKGKLRTARGSQVNTLGTVSRTVRFPGEPEEYIREFHVLPKCVHDIILGSPFLRLTQTFTKFRHRIVKKLRGMSPRHRVCLTGSSQEMLSGWANGQSILALPDTGSDICLMSLRYARERGYRVDTDPKHLQMLEFVDGSTAETSGRVEGFQWEFDGSDIQLHIPEIHVLEGLRTDLLLGYGFLEESDAFGTHEELFTDAEPHDEPVDEMFGWLVSTIKLVTKSKMWGYGRQLAQTLGSKSRNRPDPGMLSSKGWVSGWQEAH